MPMSSRLLRPRASGTALHPDAQDWIARVTTNGGTASTTTLGAMSQFCAAIAAAGIRDRFARLNLFCGSNLAACRTPLYRATSSTGTQLGNTIDTNVGPFVDADYVETGSSGGLKGNASTKWLQTGLQGTDAGANGNFHMSVYVTTADSGATFNYYTGNGASILMAQRNATVAAYTYSSMTLDSTLSAFTGHIIGTSTASTAHAVYSAGVSNTTSSVLTNQSAGTEVFVFNNGTLGALASDARLAGYSVGSGLTASQAASYYSAIQAFQTALGRQK